MAAERGDEIDGGAISLWGLAVDGFRCVCDFLYSYITSLGF